MLDLKSNLDKLNIIIDKSKDLWFYSVPDYFTYLYESYKNWNLREFISEVKEIHSLWYIEYFLETIDCYIEDSWILDEDKPKIYIKLIKYILINL